MLLTYVDISYSEPSFKKVLRQVDTLVTSFIGYYWEKDIKLQWKFDDFQYFKSVN